MGIKIPYLNVNNIAPIEGAAAVTPSNTGSLTNGKCRGLYIGGAGAVAVQFEDGNTATFAAVPVGVLWVSCVQVLSTGTAATNILALY